MKTRLFAGAAALAAASAAAPALGWSAHGHRVVTHLAMDRFEDVGPAWATSETARARAAFQSNECDRWKGLPSRALKHENNPDHFLDIEHLWLMDMDLGTLPRLRRDYLRTMVLARDADPAATPATYDPARDDARAYEYPGFLPYAIVEHYDKLRSSFRTARILGALDDPTRAGQLEQARANALYHMGALSHFVADGAQPLHVTEHFNGWVGDNPSGYTTDRGFHAAIDGGMVDRHGITRSSASGFDPAVPEIDPRDPWPATLAYLGTSFRLVEPLYAMEKSGALEESAGKAFLEERLAAGGGMLGAMYAAAWEASAPTEEIVASFVKYDDHRAGDEAGDRTGEPAGG